MYPLVKTTNTWACITAIANSRPENAIIKLKGIKPKKKNSNPDVIILYVNPLKILSNICPAVILAANLSPKDILRAI